LESIPSGSPACYPLSVMEDELLEPGQITIEDLATRADELIEQVSTDHRPLIVTDQGHPAAVLLDYQTWHKQSETLALLRILAMGKKDIREGKGIPAEEVFKEIREKYGFD